MKEGGTYEAGEMGKMEEGRGQGDEVVVAQVEVG
jgi:hypothetical protein